MKKKLLLSSFIFLGLTAFGQLMNGGFEDWLSVQLEHPDAWETSNSEVFERGIDLNATKVSSGFNDTYAIRLETKGSSEEAIVGYCINGSGDPMEGIGGIPYSMQPDSFIFNAKLGIVDGDSAIYLVIFKKEGNIISLNLGKFSGNDPETWKRHAFKLQALPVAPDSVIIGIASSDAFEENNIKLGSFIVVDNLHFSTSQSILNGDFEEWTTQSFDEPLAWMSNNYSLVRIGKNYVEKTSDAYRGTSACKITTVYEASYDYYFAEIMNGRFGETIWDGGFSYSETKDTLMGWYKYMPNQTDTAIVNIVFKKNGSEIYWSGTILLPSDTYKKFEIPLNLPSVPDSAMIQIMSSNWPLSMSNVGSVLIIDELQFKSDLLATKTSDAPAVAGFDIYPNPTVDGFYIFNTSPSEHMNTYVIRDNSGRLVKQGQLIKEKTYIDVKGLGQGIYFVTINDSDEKLTKKLMVR